MNFREDAATRFQHVEDSSTEGSERIELTPAKGRRQDMAVLSEAIAPNAARCPGVTAEDRRGNRLLGTRRRAPMIGIHFSLTRKFAMA